MVETCPAGRRRPQRTVGHQHRVDALPGLTSQHRERRKGDWVGGTPKRDEEDIRRQRLDANGASSAGAGRSTKIYPLACRGPCADGR